MNEHLKQLMLEAGYAAPELAGRAQKLAEFIVRQCIDIASKYDEPKMSGPGLMIGHMIEQHFGVDDA